MYNCGMCGKTVKARIQKHKKIIKKEDGQIAKEIAVCPSCAGIEIDEMGLLLSQEDARGTKERSGLGTFANIMKGS
jgi:hypothetical protein